MLSNRPGSTPGFSPNLNSNALSFLDPRYRLLFSGNPTGSGFFLPVPSFPFFGSPFNCGAVPPLQTSNPFFSGPSPPTTNSGVFPSLNGNGFGSFPGEFIAMQTLLAQQRLAALNRKSAGKEQPATAIVAPPLEMIEEQLEGSQQHNENDTRAFLEVVAVSPKFITPNFAELSEDLTDVKQQNLVDDSKLRVKKETLKGKRISSGFDVNSILGDRK